MNNPRVALKLAVVYTFLAALLLLADAVRGRTDMELRLLISAIPSAVLWLGWLWMRATA